MNNVILMGRLTRDPELKYSTNNIPVCRFSIAVDRPVKQGTEKKADYFNIVAWRQTAEFISKYFKKGVRIAVQGSLRNNNYEDNSGVKHYTNEVSAEKVFFADGKSDGNNASGGGFTQQPGQNQNDNAGFDAAGDPFFPGMDDDDLPF